MYNITIMITSFSSVIRVNKCGLTVIISRLYIKSLTTQNPPKSTWKNSEQLETGTFTYLFKWGKITTWQEVQAISAEYER